MEHSGYTYQSLDDLEAVKNREDRSVLTICSMHPERFLAKDIAHPDEVKHLTIILGFLYNEYFYYCKEIDKYLDKSWFYKYTDSLCSDITNFHNLETLVAEDLKLSTDLWIKFANNSKHLKEIHFSVCTSGSNNEYFNDFDFHKKEEALDALFKIPILEKVLFDKIYLPYFPPGPSYIKHLELHVFGEHDNQQSDTHIEQVKSYAQNFSTHTNIKFLVLEQLSTTPYDVKDLKLDQMQQLEELTLIDWEIDIEPILLLPNLKKIEYCTWFGKDDPLKKFLIKNSNLVFPSIEELVIYVSNNSKIDEIKKYLADVLKRQCVNIKRFVLNEQVF
jgi:hypothetical protein